MKKIKLAAIITIILILSLSSYAISQDIYKYYQEGVDILKGGDWTKTINKWFEGRNMMMAEGKADPRIGVDFLKLVTGKELSHFYERATDLYMWGFTTDEPERFKEQISKEAERIIPLLDDEEVLIWREAAKNDPGKLTYMIRKYWIENDPTPVTPGNERLLEHWRRIYDAQKRYIRAKTTPYGTDDRGLIYVKYGKPYSISKKSPGSNEKEFAFWMPRTSDRRDINMRYNTYPEIEIWVYQNLDAYQPVVYIFGTAREMPYGLYDGIEEFIPNRAFSRRNWVGNGLPPGVFFQLMFYDQLRAIDYSFERRYADISGMLMSTVMNPNSLVGSRDSFKNMDRNDPVKRNLTKSISIYMDIINEIVVNVSHMRYLDDENKSKLAILAMSYPTSGGENSVLKHSLIVRDEKLIEVARKEDTPPDQSDKTSIFILDHKNQENTYSISSMILQSKPAQELEEGSMLIGPSIGREFLSDLKPLNPDLMELEMSDILYGVELPETPSTAKIPFPVLPTERISAGDNLSVYFEIYHLSLDTDSKTHFAVTFQIARSGKKGIIEKLRRSSNSKEIVTQNSFFESEGTTSKQNISFDVAQFDKGEYEFFIEVRDTVSGKTVERFGILKIL